MEAPLGTAARPTTPFLAKQIRVLSEARTPVFPIEDSVDAHEEVRLKHRYLDLRRPRLQRNIRLRHQVTMEIRRHMDEQGYLKVEPGTASGVRRCPVGKRVEGPAHRGAGVPKPHPAMTMVWPGPIG